MTDDQDTHDDEDSLLLSGAAIWRELVSIGGLNTTSWDRQLTERLAERLGVPAEPPASFEAVSATAFVHALFGVAEPFVQMWDDLLRLLQSAAVTSIGSELRIEYHFNGDDEPPTTFDVGHFRKAREAWMARPSRFDLTELDSYGVLYGDYLGQSLSRDFDSATATGRHAQRFWEERNDQPWPRPFPPIPEANDPALQPFVEEIFELAKFVVDEMASVSSSRAELIQLGTKAPSGAANTPGALLFGFGNDMWVGLALQVADSLTSASLADVDADLLEQRLSLLRNTANQNTTSIRVLQEFLALPLWKHRYELFSSWVSAIVVEALADQGPRVHADGGVLSFRFSGTHLATFDLTEPPLELVTELRTALANPVGGSRKKAIQPDISLVFDHVRDAANGPVTIECKQYVRPASLEFAHALTDYARGRKLSTTVLVDQGPLNETTVLGHVADDVRSRCAAIGDLTPHNVDARTRLTGVVRSSVRLRTAKILLADLSSSCATETIAAAAKLPSDLAIGFASRSAILDTDADWRRVDLGYGSMIETAVPFLASAVRGFDSDVEVHLISDFGLAKDSLARLTEAVGEAGATLIRHVVSPRRAYASLDDS